MDVNKI